MSAGFAAEQKTEEAKFKGELIYLRDYGTDDIGYLVVPELPPEAGIVIVPEGYGIDADIKKQADALSTKGFLVMVVDLYNGAVTRNPQQAERMLKDLMDKSVLASLKTAVNFFHSSPRYKIEQVAVIAVGSTSPYVSKFSIQREPELTGVVFLEPAAMPDRVQLEQIRCPAQFHVTTDCVIDSAVRGALAESRRKRVEIRELGTNASARKGVSASQWKAVEEFVRRCLVQEKKQNILEKLFD